MASQKLENTINFIFFKGYLFRAFESIASNCKKGTFLCLSGDGLKPKKRYLFCALKHRLVN